MPGRILIVDREELPRMELSIQLQEMGYRVATAENGREAIELFERSRPQLVITELLLDHLSGFEISTRIAASKQHVCPVVFYTGFYRNEEARREVVRKYSSAGYFIKPFQLPHLKKAVVELMKKGTLDAHDETAETPDALVETPSTAGPMEPMKEQQGSSLPSETVNLEPPALDTEIIVEDVTEEAKKAFDFLKADASMIISGSSLESSSVVVPESSGNSAAEIASPASEPDSQEAQSLRIFTELKSTEDLPLPVEAAVEPAPLASFQTSPKLLSKKRKVARILLIVLLLLAALYLIYRHYPRINRFRFNASQSPSQESPKASADLAGLGPAGEGGPKRVSTAKPESTPSPDPRSSAGIGHIPAGAAFVPSKSSPSGRRDPADRDSSPLPASSSGPPMLKVKVSEVSGQSGPPRLRQHPRLTIPLSKAKVLTRPLVMRVEVDASGKIVGAQPVNLSDENRDLLPIAMESIAGWSFSETDTSSTATTVKYFSFRLERIEAPSNPARGIQ